MRCKKGWRALVVRALCCAVRALAAIPHQTERVGPSAVHVFVALSARCGHVRCASAPQAGFCEAFKRHAPEFQTAKGYPTNVATTANLGIASKQVGCGTRGAGTGGAMTSVADGGQKCGMRCSRWAGTRRKGICAMEQPQNMLDKAERVTCNYR